MLLQSRDITVQRVGAPLLAFPDVSINEGGRVLLLGPSGSGKTTFLSVLAGLLEPTQGSVLLRGDDLYDLSPSARDHQRGQLFGFVFQALHLLPSLTLAQNILLAGDMAGQKPEEGRLEYLLETLGLADKADRRPNALSQGEQQRGAIARAVLLKPKIILADELTSALDDDNAHAVMGLIDKQAEETGAALLIATHDNRIKSKFDTVINLRDDMREAP